MPKGQYDRKPRTMPSEAAQEPEDGVGAIVMGGEPVAPSAPVQGVPIAPTYLQTSQTVHPVPTLAESIKAAERPGFDDWMEDDTPPAMPMGAFDRPDFVNGLVGGWAASVCSVPYTVMWLPTKDADGIEVTLTTEHGASILTTPLTGWTQAEVEVGLDHLRAELFPEGQPELPPAGGSAIDLGSPAYAFAKEKWGEAWAKAEWQSLERFVELRRAA